MRFTCKENITSCLSVVTVRPGGISFGAGDEVIREFLNKLYGNAVVFANLRGQRRVPYLPEVEDIIFLTKGEFVHPRDSYDRGDHNGYFFACIDFSCHRQTAVRNFFIIGSVPK